MDHEARFRWSSCATRRYATLVKASREAVRQRRALYEQLAHIQIPTEKSNG
jgi:hypothetical protein